MKSLQGILVTVLVIIVIITSSLCFIIFGSKQHNGGQTYTDVRNEEWKADVAKRLYKEFCEFYSNMPNDDYVDTYHKGITYGYQQARYNGKTGYSRLMAADRACGILTVYGDYLTEEELKDVKTKAEEVRNELFDRAIVNFGYSESGLHFMTINYASDSYYYDQKFAANQVRDLPEESDFLMDCVSETGNQLLDVFVEDLSADKENISIEPILSDCIEKGKFIKTKRLSAIDEKLTGFLKDRDRNCITDENVSLKNGSWNLFPFKGNSAVDSVIIKNGDEELELFNAALDKDRLNY